MTPTDNAGETRDAELNLIRAVIACYHTTRLSEVSAESHVSAKPGFKRALAAFLAAAQPEKAGEEAPVAAWVLQRNDFPHTVYFDEAEARAECARRHEEEIKWREENRHVADVKTYWNVYKTMNGAFAAPTQQAVVSEGVGGLFMCTVDFEDELGNAAGGNTVFPSLNDLKRNRSCWNSCGVVEVHVSFVREVVAQDLSYSPSSAGEA
jgi:hypothetical protein